MPFTSSVFPVPRFPSRAMTSPASTTCPRRRPSSRVSSTDVVSTKVFIAGSVEPFHSRAVAEPNAAASVDLSDHGQWEVDALEDAPGGRDPRGRRRADQFEVLGVADGERPLLPVQTSRQREALDIDRRPEPRAVEQSLDLAMQPVADVAADPDAGVDQHAPGDHAWYRIQLRGDPSAFSRRCGPAPGFEESQAGRGAAERAGHGEEPARACPIAPQHGARRIDTADQRGRQGEQPKRSTDVSSGDRAAEPPRLFRNALVETARVGNRKRPAQRERDERVPWLRAHRRQVAEVDGHQAATELSEIEPRPLHTKIDLLNHGVSRRHHERIAAPDRGIILRRRNQQGSRRRIKVATDRPQEAALAEVRKRPRPARDAMGYTGRPSTGLLATAFQPIWARPALNARRPATTASAKARAISGGFCARAIAVLTRTAAAPTSRHRGAAGRTPRDASTMTGTLTLLTINSRFSRFCNPSVVPMGAAPGMTAAAPAS